MCCVPTAITDPFTIITREAGAGGISLGIEGPSKAVIDFQDKRDGTSDVYYTVTEPGMINVQQKLCNELFARVLSDQQATIWLRTTSFRQLTLD